MAIGAHNYTLRNFFPDFLHAELMVVKVRNGKELLCFFFVVEIEYSGILNAAFCATVL